ncbi:hypothetical protein QTN47_26990 [Danxiaibacter flavus]|uniref:DUF4149 domain-containing protein n=1 Tax=Danxiaibacter flavus TaxID=3049108 RepID=A0ABV3ZNS6_9BACT|nr:hypothetical protein QNM32_26990 [Chitinophagaceae bacterium DXS]
MKGLFIYRFLGFFVNIGAFMMAFMLFGMISFAFRNPALLLYSALMLCVVLYAWFVNKFFVRVIVRKEPTTFKHRDWIRVNSIVCLVFATLSILSCAAYLLNPSMPHDLVAQFNNQVDPTAKIDPKMLEKAVKQLVWGMVIFFLILVAHILWTYDLLRRYRSHFQEPQS